MPIVDSTTNIETSLLPTTLNLSVYRGDTFLVILKMWQDRQRTNPVNLAGFTGRSEFRNQITPFAVIATPTITVNDRNGTVETGAVTIKIANTTALAPGTYNWDFQLNDGSSTRTYLAGTITIVADITAEA